MESLLWTVISFLSVITNAEGQRLNGQPPGSPKNKEYGSSLSVTCVPDSSEAALDLKWYGPNIYFPTEGERNLIKVKNLMPLDEITRLPSRIYTIPKDNTLKLMIDNIQAKDTGAYNCTGRVNNIPSFWSFQLQAYIGLQVIAEPNQFLIKTRDSQIQCAVTAQPAPEVDWYFNGDYLDLSASTKYESTAGGLIVYSVTSEDAGRYECVGTEHTNGDTLKKEIMVEVVTPPVFTAPPANATGKRWRDSSIACKATADPAPQYKWYMGTSTAAGSQPIEPDSVGTRYRPSSSNGDLTIVNIQLEDEMWFWCVAYNKGGEARGKAFFDVQMIPVFMDSNNLNKTETRQGNRVQMICQCEAEPNAKMYFQRVGEPAPYVTGVQPNDPRISIMEKSAAPTFENQRIIPREVWLTIENTTANDTSNFTCIAENVAGRNQTNMHIIIQIIPHFQLTNQSMRTQCIWEQHPRNVTVLLTGYPQPSVSWTLAGQAIGSSGQPESETARQQRTYKDYMEPYWPNGRVDEWMANLEIFWKVARESTYTPIGTYSVRASNNLGYKEVQIVVMEAQLPERPSNVQVGSRTPESITISADVTPESNCIPVIGFEIEYQIKGTVELPKAEYFTLDNKNRMVLPNLSAGTSYVIRVYSRNERGRGYDRSLEVDTLESTPPEVVEVTSGDVAAQPTAYLAVWKQPRTGGELITSYRVSWRKVGATDWESRDVLDVLTYTIKDLTPDTKYEFMVQARNRKGYSPLPSQFSTFSTPQGSVPGAATIFPLTQGGLLLDMQYIIIIAVGAVIIILVITDVSCYCSRNAGLLACICGSVSKHHGSEKDDIPLDGFDSVVSSSSCGSHSHQNCAQSLADTREKDPRSFSTTSTRAADYTQDSSSQSHEYINSGRMAPKSASVESLSRLPNYESRPVPIPRTADKSLRSDWGTSTPADSVSLRSDASSRQEYQPRYAPPRQHPHRQYMGQDRLRDPKDAYMNDVDYPDQLRGTGPTRKRPTML